jgi:hypothetical protein
VNLTLNRPEPLDVQRHDRSSFSSGVEELDVFLKERARKESPTYSRTFVLTCVELPSEILGYYSISSTSLRIDDFPEDVRRRMPRYDSMGATLLGRLAVSEKFQRSSGKDFRFGELLLFDAEYRTYQASQSVASCALVVKVIKGEKGDPTPFYERYGFAKCAITEGLMWLPLKTIEATLRKSGLIV